MSIRSGGRVLGALVLAVLTVMLTAGPAGADGYGGTRTTSWFGSAFLGSGGASGSDDAFVDFDVWKPHGVPAFGNGEFFVRGYDCTTEDTTRATIDRLQSASARGRLALDCWWHGAPGQAPGPENVRGTAWVDLRWTGVGPLSHRTLDEPGSPCVYRFADRHAEVSGTVKLVLPRIYRGVATPLDVASDHLTRERAFCR